MTRVQKTLAEIISHNLPALSSLEIECAVASVGYRGTALRDPAAEGGGWPPFVMPFVLWMAEHETIPTPAQQIALYFALFPKADNGHRKGLEARIMRAWPSLVRDQHLVALLREAGMRATYGLAWDRAGVDVAVWPPEGSGHSPLFVHAFVDTGRARGYRAAKVSGPRHIDLPLTRTDARVIGNVWLYDKPLHTEKVRAAL